MSIFVYSVYIHIHIPTFTYNRYYRAAMKVVKKRRANHVQSWRIHDCHKSLIYGGVVPIVSQMASPTRPPTSPPTRPPTPPPTRSPTRPPTRPSVHDDNDSDEGCLSDGSEFNPLDDTSGDATPVVDTSDAPVADTSAADKPVTATTFECFGCKKTFTMTEKKSSDNEWVDSRISRCTQCWEKHMRNEIIPHVADVDRRNKILKMLDKKGNNKAAPARKRSRRTCCKWCGSTTHLMRSHKDCPHNPKNPDPPTPTQNPTPPPTTTTTTPTTTPPPTTTTTTTTTPPPTTTTTPTTTRRYDIHENVTARWSRKKWYHAHVTHVHPDMTYTVYFPDDGKVKTNVHHRHIRPQTTCVPTPRRGDMIGKEFFEEGDESFPSGRFRVRMIKDNTYLCVRLTGEGYNSEYFDIGYVMSVIRSAEELSREN